MMIYSSNLNYFNKDDFPFEKAVLITAQAVSRYCQFYQAKIIAPKSGFPNTEKAGGLPSSKKERFVQEVVEWIFANSMPKVWFVLFLDNKVIINTGEACKFDHHDDTCCWALNLTKEEYSTIQKIWQKHQLPLDLFNL